MNTKDTNRNQQLKAALNTWKMLKNEKNEIMKILDADEHSELEELRLIFFTISVLNKAIVSLQEEIFDNSDWNEFGGFD